MILVDERVVFLVMDREVWSEVTGERNLRGVSDFISLCELKKSYRSRNIDKPPDCLASHRWRRPKYEKGFAQDYTLPY